MHAARARAWEAQETSPPREERLRPAAARCALAALLRRGDGHESLRPESSMLEERRGRATMRIRTTAWIALVVLPACVIKLVDRNSPDENGAVTGAPANCA